MQLIKTLLVDDDYLVLEDLKLIIDWEACGFQIIGTASNGKQALDIISREHPSLVITDISMPVMDGFDFVESARNAPYSIYFIFLSSYASFDYARRALEQEVSSYLLKNELTADILKEHLEKAKERIIGTVFNKQQTLSLSVQRLFQDEASPIESSSMQMDESYVFFYLTSQIPLEKLPHHFRRIAHSGQNLQKHISLSDHTLSSDTIIFPLNEFLILGIPTVSLTHTNYYDLYELCNKLRSTLHLDEHNQIFCYPRTLTIPENHRIFQKYQRFLKFSSIFPDALEWDLSKISDSVPKAPSLPLASSLEQPELFTKESDSFIEQCFLNHDADSLLMFFHNLMIQLEELSDHMFHFETELWVTGKTDLKKKISERYQQVIQYRNRNQRSNLSPWMNAAIDYMEAHYSDRNLNINEIAASVGLSSSRFSVLFRQESGQTVNDYLTELRIRKAIYLLEHSNCKIYEIAEKVGYQSSQYFSRVFFQKTGHKPLHFRQKRPV